MQFSVRSALTAAMLASSALACPKNYHKSQSRPAFTSSLASSSSASVVVPVPTPWAETPTSVETTPIETPTLVVPTTTEAPTTTSALHTTLTTSTAAGATTSATSSGSALTSDQQASLDAHNAARADVGEAALTWDDTLAADALTWANHLAAQGVGNLVHSGTEGQGENLYWQSGSGSPYTAAADAWIAEKADYNGEAVGDGDFESYGHYTQIIWETTTAVGMATATDSSGGVYVVARYSPPGNYIGETPTTA